MFKNKSTLILIKKESYYFIMYSLIFFTLIATGIVAINFIDIEKTSKENYTFMLGVMQIFIIPFLSVISSEQYEDKMNGYKFLKTLPVDDGIIVFTKFILNLIFIIISFLFAVILINSFSGINDMRLSIISSATNFIMLLTGIMYTGIFRFSFMRFFKYLMVFFVILTSLPVFFGIIINFTGTSDFIFKYIIDFIKYSDWTLINILNFILYTLLSFLSVKFKKTK